MIVPELSAGLKFFQKCGDPKPPAFIVSVFPTAIVGAEVCVALISRRKLLMSLIEGNTNRMKNNLTASSGLGQ